MVLSRIRQMLPDMSLNYRNIASYILDHDQNVAFASIYTTSAAIGVSNTSLVRFAKSLGFKGYQSFKKDLQNEIRRQFNPYDKIALSKLDLLPEEKRLQELFQNEYNNLHSTLSHMRLQDSETILQGIKGARKIFISAFGSTRHIARVFEASLLNSTNKDVVVITGAISDYSPQLKSFSHDDVMFIMSFHSYSPEVKHVASVVKKAGGSLYLFTDSASCPVYSFADVVITCTTNSLLYSNSYVGLVSIINILVHLVYMDSKDVAAESIRGSIEMAETGYSLIQSPLQK